MYLFKKNVITDMIESVNDWIIFGTVQFGRTTSYKFVINIFFELIRSIEKKSGSVWLLKVEGDNSIRNVHIHFIISSDGLKATCTKSNLFMLKEKFSALKKGYLSLNKASVKFEEYDKQKAAAFYLSKIETEVISKAPSFFSYIDDGICVKWSSKLKHRYGKFNLTRDPLF